jgi:lipid II:glycine glycyltransferase (peptidoglycan interpeptide bridge formation enzyme)
MFLLRNQEISPEGWSTLISNSPYSSVFQTPLFYDLCNEVPGISAEAFALEEGGNLKALCVVILLKEPGIKGYFSRRAIVYGGPVLTENNNEYCLEYLINSITNEFIKKSIYIEIRCLNNYGIFKDVFFRNGWKYVPYQNFRVDCSDKKQLYSRLGNNRKREIKKAINSGVTIKEAENVSEINEFYFILQKLYNQKIKKPLFSKKFFEKIFNKGFGKYFLVIYNNKIIGGIICPILKGRCIYEFYVCGWDEEYKEQYPSTMATWAAMEFANKNHIPIFDFMGAGISGMDYGVRDYKSRFGGELVEYGRYIKIANPILYKIGRLALKFMKLFKT